MATLLLLLLLLQLLNLNNMLSTEAISASTQNISPSAEMPCWLVVDFDGTCSERDTTPLLPKLASILESDRTDKIMEQEERIARFAELEEEFFRLYNTAKENMCHETMSLDEALDSLDDVSNHVTEKVSSSGSLRGLCVLSKRIRQIIDTNEDISERVKLRPDCVEVIAKATNMQWKLGVLSINWCPALIDAALVQKIIRHKRKFDNQKSSADINIPIWSNSIDAAGKISLHVPGALAKKERISELKSSLGDQSTVIYVGDSSTDLSALVEADIGILIGQSKSTISIGERWNVRFIPLTKWHEITQQEGSTTDVLWTVDRWSEIGEFLLCFK